MLIDLQSMSVGTYVDGSYGLEVGRLIVGKGSYSVHRSLDNAIVFAV